MASRFKGKPRAYESIGPATIYIDELLPNEVNRMAYLKTTVKGMTTIQNRSMFNFYKYSGKKFIFSVYARLAMSNNKSTHLYSPVEPLKMQLGVQSVVGSLGSSAKVSNFFLVDYKWRRYSFVVSAAEVNNVFSPNTLGPKNNTYLEWFLQFGNGSTVPYEVHTAAWKVEEYLYPSNYPEEKVIPSKWVAKPYAQDLDEVQRFYCKSYDLDTPIGTNNVNQGCLNTVPDPSNSKFHTPTNGVFPVRMNKRPVIQLFHPITSSSSVPLTTLS